MEKYKFFEPLRVRFQDTDLQGHVYFGTLLTYFDEGLTGYMHALHCSYQDLKEAGVDMFYIHTECDFKSEAFFEETLNIYVRAGKIGNSSVTFEFAVIKSHNDEWVATGNIIAVIVDPQTKKPVRVPDVFRDAATKFENGN
ncbi:MAG: acyl-CoA thioesterase [Chloroflexi bacterium]|nr:acyl-CoA thioesterase [Chloroflexota bacterium]